MAQNHRLPEFVVLKNGESHDVDIPPDMAVPLQEILEPAGFVEGRWIFRVWPQRRGYDSHFGRGSVNTHNIRHHDHESLIVVTVQPGDYKTRRRGTVAIPAIYNHRVDDIFQLFRGTPALEINKPEEIDKVSEAAKCDLKIALEDTAKGGTRAVKKEQAAVARIDKFFLKCENVDRVGSVLAEHPLNGHIPIEVLNEAIRTTYPDQLDNKRLALCRAVLVLEKKLITPSDEGYVLTGYGYHWLSSIREARRLAKLRELELRLGHTQVARLTNSKRWDIFEARVEAQRQNYQATESRLAEQAEALTADIRVLSGNHPTAVNEESANAPLAI